jgi:hypothetical protein
VKPYSDFSRQRLVQILSDVAAVVLLVCGILMAVAIHDAIAAFDRIGRDVEESGRGLATTMSDVGESLSSTPLIGESISEPFDAASSAAGTLVSAGRDWQLGVQTLAAISAWTVVAIVVVFLAAVWIRPRLAGALRRGRLARLTRSPNAVEVLAFRALTSRPPRELEGIHPSVMDAWRRGDPDVIRRLAALELRSAGVRFPT